MTRKYTNAILELVDEGVINRDMLIRDLLMWMSEDEVREFYDMVEIVSPGGWIRSTQLAGPASTAPPPSSSHPVKKPSSGSARSSANKK
jgi:hypothetical protein